MSKRTAAIILFCGVVLLASLQVVTAAAAAAAPAGQQQPQTPEEEPSPTPEDEEEEEAPTPTPAAAATPTPDVELEKAKRDAILAAERKKIEEAERDTLKAEVEAAKARLGIGDEDVKPAATPPSGNVTSDYTSLIETQILAGAAAREASRELAAKICKSGQPVKTLVINNGLNRSSVQNYKGLVAQVRALHLAYQEYIKDARAAFEMQEDPDKGTKAIPAALIAPAVSQTIKSVADVINLFRTETEYKNVTVSAVDEEMMVTLLADALLSRAGAGAGCSIKGIYYPTEYSPNIVGGNTKSPLLELFGQLRADQAAGDAEVARNKAAAAKLGKELEELEARLAELEKEVKTKPDLRDELNFGRLKRALLAEKVGRLNLSVANLEAFKTATAAVVGLFSEVNETTKQTLLTEFLQAERLTTILDDAGTYALDLTVKAAGMLRIRRNLFFNAKTAHTGGVTASVRLYDNGGLMVFGTVQDYYIEFSAPERIRRALGFKKLEELSR